MQALGKAAGFTAVETVKQAKNNLAIVANFSV